MKKGGRDAPVRANRPESTIASCWICLAVVTGGRSVGSGCFVESDVAAR
jgi:hypothetical protein